MGFQGFYVFSRSEGKGLIFGVELGSDPPYSDRQRHKNPISVPNQC